MDNEDFHRMKGDSASFLSDIKGEACGFRGRPTQGADDTMAVGAGGGGGVCLVVPLFLVAWAGLKLRRRFAGKEAPAAPGV